MKLLCTSGKIIALFKKSLLAFVLFCFALVKTNAQTYVNGNLSTGLNASTGEVAPDCATWSEVQTGNTTAGYTASLADGFTVADDFTVPGGVTWNVTKFTFYAYSTGYAGNLSPFDSVRVRIYNSDPSVGNPAPIFGDLVANRFITSYFAKMFRIFDGTADQVRKIWQIEASVPISLTTGTYWVEWQVGTNELSNFSPMSTVAGTVTQPGNNALQHDLTLNTWTPVVDGPNPPTDAPNLQDMPFMIDYSTSACTGTPTPGNTIFNDLNGCTIAAPVVCPAIPFLLSAENPTAGSGVIYQWQSSPDGISYTDIPGATNNTLLTSLTTAELYYQAVVTCSGTPGTSTPIHVGLTPAGQCYCIPISTDCTDGDIITNVTLAALNNTSDCGVDGFTDYTIDPNITVPELVLGVANPISVTAGNGLYTETVAAWVDYDHNGSFDPSEFTFIGSTMGGILSANIAVPATAPPGAARMRVRVSFLVTDPLGDGDACLLYTYGETEDYTVNIVACTQSAIATQPLPATVVCGRDTSFTVVGTGSLLVYQWQQRINASAPWIDVIDGTGFSGATTSVLHVLGVTESMSGYQYQVIVTAACGADINSNAAQLTVNPIVIEVSPNPVNVCLPSGLVPISITTLTPFTNTVTTSYSSGTLNVTVPDLDDVVGITNTITVPALPPGAVITGASVTLNATHTYAGDLIFALKAPNGNVFNLDYEMNSTGGPGVTTGLTNTVISSTGTTTLDLGTDPWTGIFAPDGVTTTQAFLPPSAPSSLIAGNADVSNFSDLYSIPSGNWTLGVFDYVSPDEGTLIDWTLTLTYNFVTNVPYNGTWNPVTGLYIDPAGANPYIAGSLQSTVYLQPTVSTTYTVTPVTTNCTGTPLSIPVNITTPVGTLTQPVDALICENNSTSFAVSASSGTGIVYQWQVSTDGGTLYNDVVDGGVYSGATTGTLTLTNVLLTYNGYKYRAILTVAACSSAVTSDPATLTVTPGGATITSQPVNSVVCEGENNTFTVVATGTGLIYQWQLSTTGCAGTFTDIPGANTNSYTIANATAAQDGYAYICVITGTCSPLTSNCVTLNVNTGSTILVQPADVSACEGGTAVFTSSGSGSATYQWQVSIGGGPFADIPGETNATLTLPAVTAGLNGNQYQVIIANTNCPGTVTSTTVTLTVTTSPAISTQPVDVVACSGTDAVFTVASPGTGVLYQWQVNTGGGPFSNMPGETNETLTIPAVTAALSGNQYQVILTIAGCTGTTTSTVVTLTVNEGPVFITEPAGTGVCEGTIALFETTATGTGLSYQWQESIDNGATFNDIPGATSSTYSIPAVTAAQNNNQYQVIITGACPPSITSTPATLTVNTSPVITTQPVNASTCINGSGSFTVAATGGNIFYQWEMSTTGCGGPWVNIASATSATLVTPSVTVTTYYRCRLTNACSVGFIDSDCATLTVTAAIDITSQPVDQSVCSGSDAVFTVATSASGVNYQWQVSIAAGPFTDMPGETNATLTIPAVTVAISGNQYQVVLTNPGCPDATTSTVVTLTVNELPTFTTQPVDATVCEGDVATFASNANGTNITYQWQVSIDNGTSYSDIPGATAAVFVTAPVTAAMNGYLYQVIVTGTCAPAATSTAALLTVNPTTAITTQPVDVSSCAGTDVTFTVVAAGAGLTYQWQVSTTGCAGTFTDLAGETNAGLTLTGITAAQNNNAYHCVVTGACGTAVTSNCAVLTVGTLDITTQPADQAVCAGSPATFTVATSGSGVTYQWQVSVASGPYTDMVGATTNILTIPVTALADNGNQYVVVVSNSLCPAVTSTPATLTVTGPVNITTQPVNIVACENADATFSVSTDGGAGTLLQWQGSIDGGATFTDITAATNTTFILTAVTPAMNGNIYHVVVTNPACASVVTSINVTLTVNALPTITAIADASEVCSGADVHLTAAGAGAGSYTWNPGGLNGATVTVQPAVDPGTPGSPNPILYIVTGADGNGCIGSATVTVTANPLPVVTITADPANTSLLPGQSTVLTATVDPNGTYEYSWTKDGTIVPGATTSSITVNNGEAGLYAATASGTGGICAGTSNTIEVRDSVLTGFNIYPNPNNGQFTVVYPNLPAKSSVGVFDSHGSRVSVKTEIDVNQAIHIDMRPMASGVYMVVVYNGAGERLMTGKVIVVE